MASSSAFAAAWTRASPAIDRCFGEFFLFEPMTAGAAGRPVTDPTRPAKRIVGALTEKPTFAYPESRSTKSSIGAQEATQQMMIDIQSAALPYEPRTGDRLLQLDPVTLLPTGAAYEVNGPQPDGIARNELRVFKRSAAAVGTP